jgi:dolichol kinase
MGRRPSVIPTMADGEATGATIGFMIAGAVAVLVVLGLLLIAERIKKHEKLNPEIARKFVHITVGSFVAFWPFWIPANVIYIICLGFISVDIFSRITGWFPSIHKVPRKTWGDVLFPVGIAATLWLANDPWIFTAAILHLSLADGFAALAGEKYGKTNAYKILGYKKTFAGNVAFFLISLAIVMGLIWFEPGSFSAIAAPVLLLVPLFATTIESLSVRGSDNILVPVLLTLLLNALQAAA